VYRVSDGAVNIARAPPAPNQANTIKNSILAFGRMSMINDSDPYKSGGVPPSRVQTFVATNNPQERMRKALSRIPASPIPPIRRTTSLCARVRRASDLSCLIRTRLDG
jgi:hypothetical protein